MIIVTVGMPCSGKTTALGVCRDLGAQVVASGDIVREEIANRGLPYDKKTDSEMAAWFHERGREKELIKRIMERLTVDPKKSLVAIDGLRAPEQIAELKKVTKARVVVVALEVPFEERLRRCMVRSRFPDENETYLKSRDEAESERGLADVIHNAEYKFNASGSVEDFKKRFKVFVKEIMEE